jgi:hypothetical protein
MSIGLLVCLFSAAEAASLKFEIADRSNWRADKASEVARSVEETYSYDEAADTVTIVVKFDKQGFAPLPPMVALAARYGFPVQIAPPPVDTGKHGALGPLVGVAGADQYAVTVKGLAKYVVGKGDWPNLCEAPSGPFRQIGPVPSSALARLQRELESEVAKIIRGGHLAPWFFLVNVPGSGADDRGDVYWCNPAETLYLLAEAAPLLSPESRTALTEYLRAERERFPPEKQRSMPFAEGTRREFCEPAKALLKKWEEKNFGYLTRSLPNIWSLYGLARYYELVGEKPSGDVMECCREIVARSLEHRDWATLYWRRGHTPAFNAVHGVNQLFAGLVGYIRLARLVGDKDAENLGWGLFARAAALRLAMGKYTQYMHEARLFNVYYDFRSSRRFQNATPQDLVIKVETDPARYTLPEDPAWWVKRHAGDWLGELVTWNWSRPIDDVRQVHRLDETGVDVWEWCGTDCYGTGQKRDASEEQDYWYMRLGPYLLPFRDMVPELGRFMADHLKLESEAFCRRVVENQPHWYVTYAEAILSGEIGFNMPCDAHGQFLARAWILGERPEQLERYIDVPWL